MISYIQYALLADRIQRQDRKRYDTIQSGSIGYDTTQYDKIQYITNTLFRVYFKSAWHHSNFTDSLD